MTFLLAQTNLIYQLPFVFTRPVLTNQISNLARSSYKFSLHIRAKVPNKKLTSIDIEIVQLVEGVVMSNLWKNEGSVNQKSVSFDSDISVSLDSGVVDTLVVL